MFMYMYMYWYIYIYIYMYMYMHMHTYICIYIYIYRYIRTYTHTYIYTYMCVCVCVCVYSPPRAAVSKFVTETEMLSCGCHVRCVRVLMTDYVFVRSGYAHDVFQNGQRDGSSKKPDS